MVKKIWVTVLDMWGNTNKYLWMECQLIWLGKPQTVWIQDSLGPARSRAEEKQDDTLGSRQNPLRENQLRIKLFSFI